MAQEARKMLSNEFQSTLPREERQSQRQKKLTAKNFNPRSHERSDYVESTYRLVTQYISIHAPTRGATARIHDAALRGIISIHAPTRGATVFPHQV